jgi:peptidoglycan/LPS O-acetylase OafA/YrhL
MLPDAAGSTGDGTGQGAGCRPPKFAYLDSLRGLASIIVVLAHYVGTFYPWAIFGQRYSQRCWLESWLQRPPFSLVTAGHFAVCLFFILSGYVLSIGFLVASPRKGDLLHAALKRPVRLGGLALFTVAVGYALMCAQLVGPNRISPAVTLPWLDTFWTQTPQWKQFLGDFLLAPLAHGTTYNPPLWTIHKELVGSYLVFGYVALARRLSPNVRYAVLACMAGLTFRSLYLGFVIGLAFAELTAAGSRSAPRPQRKVSLSLTFALLAGGLWLGAQLHYLPASRIEGALGVLQNLFAEVGTGGSAMLGAALTFAALWRSVAMQRMLDCGPLRYLGRISFAVYALHFLLLGSVAAGVHGALVEPLGWHAAALVSASLSLACLFPLAELATRWVDQPCTRLASAMAPIVATTVARWRKLPLAASRSVLITDRRAAQLVCIANEERITPRKAG